MHPIGRRQLVVEIKGRDGGSGHGKVGQKETCDLGQQVELQIPPNDSSGLHQNRDGDQPPQTCISPAVARPEL